MNPQDDIRTASTPAGERYSSQERLERQKEELFSRSFQLLPELAEQANHSPFSLLPG